MELSLFPKNWRKLTAFIRILISKFQLRKLNCFFRNMKIFRKLLRENVCVLSIFFTLFVYIGLTRWVISDLMNFNDVILVLWGWYRYTIWFEDYESNFEKKYQYNLAFRILHKIKNINGKKWKHFKFGIWKIAAICLLSFGKRDKPVFLVNVTIDCFSYPHALFMHYSRDGG